jgi:hypothetical protein
MKRPLIVGYGNSLREDDGIGLRAAELVESNPTYCSVTSSRPNLRRKYKPRPSRFFWMRRSTENQARFR